MDYGTYMDYKTNNINAFYIYVANTVQKHCFGAIRAEGQILRQFGVLNLEPFSW